MSILKRGADMVYTFRFIRMLVMSWTSWDAYKEGLIDKNGKRLKDVKIETVKKTVDVIEYVSNHPDAISFISNEHNIAKMKVIKITP